MRSALVFAGSDETLALVRNALDSQFQLEVCAGTDEIRQYLKKQTHDIVIADLGWDGGPSIALFKEIRANIRFHSLPLFFLCSMRDTALTVRAFEAGCDDLIYVPFAAEEMRARIEARFRRLRAPQPVTDLFWKADLRFSLATQRVVSTDASGERDLALTPNEFKILYLLARYEGEALARHAILSEVWGENLHVIERTVDKHICSLRRKMGNRAYYVQSIPGSGYCFSVASPEAVVNAAPFVSP